MTTEAEEIRKQMRQFQNAAEHFLGPVADFTTKSLNDGRCLLLHRKERRQENEERKNQQNY